MAQWQLTTDWEINSVVAAKHGITLDESNTLPRSCFDGVRKPIVGSYRGLLAIASFLRWEFINVNGYNPIVITRLPGYVSYGVRTHFGSPGYTICTLETLERHAFINAKGDIRIAAYPTPREKRIASTLYVVWDNADQSCNYLSWNNRGDYSFSPVNDPALAREYSDQLVDHYFG